MALKIIIFCNDNKEIGFIKPYLLRLFLEKIYVVFVTFSPDSTHPAEKTQNN